MNIRSRLTVIALVVVLVMAVLQISRLLQPVEDGVRAAMLPVARLLAAAAAGARNALIGTPEARELAERTDELEARLNSLVVDYVRLRALEDENRSLAASLEFERDTGYDFVPARVIARSVDPRSATVVIDRGAKDGVESGMAVVIGNGILVGKVTSLKERVSTVTLVSDGTSRLAAAAVGNERLFGLVEGGGNNVARLTLVPQSEPLKRNDLIITAGTEEKIPPHLVIGIVNEVEGTDTDPFKNASIEPLAKRDRLDIVMILRPAALRPTGGSN